MKSNSTVLTTHMTTFILLLFFNLLMSQAKGNSNYRNRNSQDLVNTFYSETRHFYTTDISTYHELIQNKMLKEADVILKRKKEEYFSRFSERNYREADCKY